jgi:hypothetical protein
MRSTTLLCFVLLLGACSGDDHNPVNTCDVINPVTQLPWLKASIESYQKYNGTIDITVEQGVYQFKTVFIIIPCCPACYLVPPPVHTCEGTAIENLSPGDPAITDRKVIWKTPALKAVCR